MRMLTGDAKSGSEVHLRIQLRRKDMDGLGHLNHSKYHDFFEEVRVLLMQAIGGEWGRFVLRRVEVDYLSEVRHEHGHVDVRARVVDSGRRSIGVQHEMTVPDGTVVATNRGVLVAWDPARRSARELSADERAALLDVGGQ